MKKETWLPGEIYKNRKLVFSLAKNDFKTKYAGSYFGTVWAFVQPIVTICVYWFVFGLALRNGSDKGVPFVLWLIAGLVPWFFIQEGLTGGTNALLEYNYLVKKVVFNIRILPVVKVFSAVFVHCFFVVIVLVNLYLHGISAESVCTAAGILQLLHFYADSGNHIYDKCGGCILQRSESDHQYYASGWCMGYPNHVGL